MNSVVLDGVTICFGAVANRAGVAPDFWGRYIGGNFAISAAEGAFIHANNCKINIAYNGTSNTAGSVQGGMAEGQQDAAIAIAAANALAVTAGTAIYADIEGSWSPTPDWMRGWATSIVNAGFTPGTYCDATPGRLFDIAYCVAAPLEPAVAGCYLWSMEPEPNPQCMAAGNAPAFNPNSTSCGGNAVIWQYTIDCWEDILGPNQGIDMDQATDAALAAMW